MCPAAHEPIEYAQTRDGIVIIRVHGKGTHQNSAGIKTILDRTKNANPPARYIIDLRDCEALDSTFMGILASLALHQKKRLGTAPIVLNMSPHVQRLLETLGLKYLLDLRTAEPVSANTSDEDFKPQQTPELSKEERLVMMIQAHHRLIDVDSQNELKFRGVLHALRESLERERGQT